MSEMEAETVIFKGKRLFVYHVFSPIYCNLSIIIAGSSLHKHCSSLLCCVMLCFALPPSAVALATSCEGENFPFCIKQTLHTTLDDYCLHTRMT